MKRIIYLLLCCVMLASLLCAACCAQASEEVAITAKEAILVAENGEVLFEKNSSERRPIASMTKIMTLLCVYDAIGANRLNLGDTVTVSPRAASMGGSQVFLEANGKYKAEELIKSIVVCSANDSCVALAEHIEGSVEAFVDVMNKKAASLGLENTFFENCTGLPAVSQHSCARDVAMMMLELIKQPHYFSCAKIWMQNFTHPDGRVTEMTNTNKLVRFYNGCDAGKTGYTSEAKHCLSATACRNGMRVVSVIVGADDSKTRFNEVSALFDYAFARYENKTYVANGAQVGSVSVKGGKQKDVNVVAGGTLQCFGRKGEVQCDVVCELNDVSAPIKNGEKVGVVKLVRNGEVIASVDAVAANDVEEKTLWDYYKQIICG